MNFQEIHEKSWSGGNGSALRAVSVRNCVGYFVIVKKSSPKNLLVDCQLTDGRLLVNSQPTDFATNTDYQSADSPPTDDGQLVMCRQHVGTMLTLISQFFSEAWMKSP